MTTDKRALRLSRETVRELDAPDLNAVAAGRAGAVITGNGCTGYPSVDVLHQCTSYFPSCLCAPTALC